MAEKQYFRPRRRQSANRDARLIIIATEGLTECKYFQQLSERFANSRIHVHIINREFDNSSPIHVMGSLDDFRKKYLLKKGWDELWLVGDVDRWSEKELSEVSSSCSQKNYCLAISNPCFEFWLLLHHVDIFSCTPEKLSEYKNNKRNGNKNRTLLERELVRIVGEHNKSNFNPIPYFRLIDKAIHQARKLDQKPEERWPSELGSRVYLLVEKIL